MKVDICLRELTYARLDLAKVTEYLETALEAVEGEGEKSTLDTIEKDMIEGALYRANMLRKEVYNLIEKFEATATEK